LERGRAAAQARYLAGDCAALAGRLSF